MFMHDQQSMENVGYKLAVTGSSKLLFTAPKEGFLGAMPDSHYSIKDWGHMPDEVEGKGLAIAMMSGYLGDKMQNPKNWKKLMKSNVWGDFSDSKFMWGLMQSDEMQGLMEEGLGMLYWGMVGDSGRPHNFSPDKQTNVLYWREAKVVKPGVLMRGLSSPQFDYSAYPELREGGETYMLPSEFVFRFGLPKGSSLIGTLQSESFGERYLHDIGLTELPATGCMLPRPINTPETKFEEGGDRKLFREEAMRNSGLGADEYRSHERLNLLAALFLKHEFAKSNIDLWDGKFEWAPFRLADAVGPDELRIIYNGVHVSKESFRQWYKQHDQNWFQAFAAAKKEDKTTARQRLESEGIVPVSLSEMDPRFLALMSQMYLTVTEHVTGADLGSGTTLDSVCGQLSMWQEQWK